MEKSVRQQLQVVQGTWHFGGSGGSSSWPECRRQRERVQRDEEEEVGKDQIMRTPKEILECFKQGNDMV